MRREASMEAWLFILLIIATVVGIFVLGLVAVKTYRKFRPFEEEVSDGFSISVSHSVQSDGFFKILFVGLALSSPILYFIYSSL